MLTRRHFVSKIAATGILSSFGLRSTCSENKAPLNKAIFLSTWNNQVANNQALEVNKYLGIVDAIEAGIMTVEANPDDSSVGFGGRPDRDGNVTLDACIMNHEGDAGSVCFLQEIKHPIALARKVMEDTPHVILSGKGAQQFAENQGFKKENLLTDASKKAWEQWMTKKAYKPVINIENHDTIGMIGMTKDGRMAGGCSTSGLAFKMQGRVGDSPIIGAGLYVDGEVGAATATGLGEAVLKSLSTFLVVEFMRMGKSPQEACELSIARITEKQAYKDFQVGLLAFNKSGEFGAFSIQPGFKYTLSIGDKTTVNEANSYIR